MTRPNPDVDAVIFDFAGVLSTSPGDMMRRQIDESGIDVEIDLASFIQIIMGPLDVEGDHPWHRLERGRIDFDEYVAGIEPLWRAAGFETFPTIACPPSETWTCCTVTRCSEPPLPRRRARTSA